MSILTQMRLLWFTWKDIKHPNAGGAEIVNHELAKRLVKNGHRVTMVVAGWKKALKEEKIDGYIVIRVGSRWTVYWKAYKYYKKHLKRKFDMVIDEINTIPFFAKFYVREKNILFIHQLAREIWFYQMYFPLSLIGYILEPLFLWRLKDRKVITISESTKADLIRFGFKPENIYIISEGIEIEPIKFLSENDKFHVPTMLSLGSIRPMKRTDHIFKAFLIAKEHIKDLRLVIAGDASIHYGSMLLDEIALSPHKESVRYLGKIGREEKIDIMKKCHVLCMTSVKEGWGLTVTEANSQGTPAVVYNVDGLRDSVKHERTGLVCHENTPKDLADNIISLFDDKERYDRMRRDGWHWSKEINFEKSYKDFVKVIVSIK